MKYYLIWRRYGLLKDEQEKYESDKSKFEGDFPAGFETDELELRERRGKWRGGRLFRFFVFFYRENFKQKDYIYKRII